MKNFVLLTAIPGSGKSTWARKYAENHPNTHVVSSDEIRQTYFGAVNNFEHEKEVWDIYRKEIHRYAIEENVTVIADSTNISNKLRQFYAKQTPEFDRHTLVYFAIPYDICCQQNKMRTASSVVPDYAMERMRNRFEEPDQKTLDMYDEFLIINETYLTEK